MVEHANIILEISDKVKDAYWQISCDLTKGGYGLGNSIIEPLFLRCTNFGKNLISGNLRAFYEYIVKNIEHSSIAGCVLRYLKTKIPIIFDDIVNPHEIITNDCENGIFKIADSRTLFPKEMEIHDVMTVVFHADRGFSHELVRMRLCSFAQISTRYVDFTKSKHGKVIKVIRPMWAYDGKVSQKMVEFAEKYGRGYSNLLMETFDTIMPELTSCFHADFDLLNKMYHWTLGMIECEKAYFNLRELDLKPEQARAVLPIGLETEIVCTATLKEWKHIFELRTASYAHPMIRGLMRDLCTEVKMRIPNIFDEIDWRTKEEKQEAEELIALALKDLGYEVTPDFENLIKDKKMVPFTFRKMTKEEIENERKDE